MWTQCLGALVCVAALFSTLLTDTKPVADTAPLRDNASGRVRPRATGERLLPSDLAYLGAFRVPDVSGAPPATWDWSGQAMTANPAGDPAGGGDGFPGSLFATGIDTENWISEISIPEPSLSRAVEQLPRALTLQPFADVRQGLFSSFTELPRVGMELLSAQSGQLTPKLHLAWGQHFHDDPSLNIAPTHAWCELDLADPQTQGAWWIGDQATATQGFIYSVNGYVFALPDQWADLHVGGMRLACGRYRDGGWSGMGPSMIAYGPWLDGLPPPPGAELRHTPLLLYSTVEDPAPSRLDGYSHADAWEGGAWLESGSGSAVVFVGTKAAGYTWYGFYTPDGVAAPPLYPEGAPCVYRVGDLMCTQPDGVTPCTDQEMQLCEGAPIEEQSRGWWASRFDAVLLFYDPADFEAVATGSMAPDQPQPYAALDIDEHLFLNATMPDFTMYHGFGTQRNARIGEPAYDRVHGLLYVPELFADEYRPIIHVWEVR